MNETIELPLIERSGRAQERKNGKMENEKLVKELEVSQGISQAIGEKGGLKNE